MPWDWLVTLGDGAALRNEGEAGGESSKDCGAREMLSEGAAATAAAGAGAGAGACVCICAGAGAGAGAAAEAARCATAGWLLMGREVGVVAAEAAEVLGDRGAGPLVDGAAAVCCRRPEGLASMAAARAAADTLMREDDAPCADDVELESEVMELEWLIC
jgi:hypothetical protein